MTTRWGILAAGRIAHTLANAITNSETGEVAAVGSRSMDKAEEFASKYAGCKAHDSYEALIADDSVDAIYVATPHPMHVEWTIKALNAGKSVLCEKPMGLNHAEVMAMVHAAEQNQQLLVEAFMYRMHPQTQKVRDLLDEAAIGELRHITATFGFNAPFSESGRLYAAELGGGGIMDVGCYPVSMCRLIVGSEPTRVVATGKLAQTGADIYTSALLEFENGVGAHVATGVGQQLDNNLSIFGSRGSLHIPQPWLCPENWNVLQRQGGELNEHTGTSASPYIYQVDEVDRCRKEGLLQSPCMNWKDSLGNATVLDKWRAAIGVSYPQEQPETLSKPIHIREDALAQATMPTDEIGGIDRPLSRVVMGCDNQPNLPHATQMFDHYVNLGGNVFDTAYIYGGGKIETLLGQWLTSRGNRDEIVLIGKGAHTPLNRPEYCRPQLNETLDRLQTDHLDIYFLHRDNLEVPVSEWIDALNELRDDGLLHIFGGSNWTLDRVRQANEYASSTNKQGFSAVSNQFSLAKMLSPVWPGCVSANSDDYRAFLLENDLALFPWSSQARGFFTDRFDTVRSGERSQSRGALNQPGDEEMKRCWFSDENFQRRERAVALANKHNVSTINIALAYVLAQPFKAFPLMGPRYLWETSSSLNALQVQLSVEEMASLDLAD